MFKNRLDKYRVITVTKKIILIIPFVTCLFIHLAKINNYIVDVSEIWLILTPFRFIEPLQSGYHPGYFYLAKFFLLFNILSLKPYIFLRLINLLFVLGGLFYIFKVVKEIFNSRIAFWTILIMSLGSFFNESMLTAKRGPLVVLLAYVSLYYFISFFKKNKNKHFIIFMVSEVIVTSIDTHAIFGFIFKVFYLIYYKKRVNFKIIISFVIVGINFFITTVVLYFSSRANAELILDWWACLYSIKSFFHEFIPNFILNSIFFPNEYMRIGAYIIIIMAIVAILLNISNRKVKFIAMFFVFVFLSLVGMTFITKKQFFIARYLLYLIPLWISLVIHVVYKRIKIAPLFISIFIGLNTFFIFAQIGHSGYSPIFRAIEKYKPEKVFSLKTKADDINELIMHYLYPEIEMEIELDNFTLNGDRIMIMSIIQTNSEEVVDLSLFDSRGEYMKIFEYNFNDAPGSVSSFLILEKKEEPGWVGEQSTSLKF